MLDVSSNPVQARGWAVIWDACSDLTDAAQTQVTKQRQEGVQAEFVGPRRIGAWVGSDTLGPCPRQDAVSGTPLLQQEERHKLGIKRRSDTKNREHKETASYSLKPYDMSYINYVRKQQPD